MRLSWFIANRIGREKTKLGGIGNIIALGSVTISVIVIIVAIAISNGFRKEIKEKALAFTGDATISPLEGSVSIDSLKALDAIQTLPFVKSAVGVSFCPAMIKTDDQIQGVILQGVPKNFDWKWFENSLAEGTLPSEENAPSILISSRIARMMNLKCGESTLLYFISDNNVKVRKFQICGIYSLQFEEYDVTYLYTTKETVNALNGWEPQASSAYMINYKDHTDDAMNARRNALIDAVYKNMEEEDCALNVMGVQDSMSALFDWLNLLDTNVLIILILMILVAGFNMVSSLLIILFENIYKIGVLKTLGMNNWGIKRIFLAKSAKIVFFGILLGDAIGVIICLVQKYFKVISLNPDTYFLDAVPIDFNVWNVLFTDVVCFAAIMIILLIPCHFISKINPAKTIKVS